MWEPTVVFPRGVAPKALSSYCVMKAKLMIYLRAVNQCKFIEQGNSLIYAS